MPKPKCPKPERLRQLTQQLKDFQTAPDSEFEAKWLTQENEMIEALEWLADMLENRNNYHKLQALKNKHLRRIAEERGLLDEAVKSAKDELTVQTGNEPDDMPYNIDMEEKDAD